MDQTTDSTIVFPDYKEIENYEAIVSLCPPEDRELFKSFEDIRALTLEAAEQGRRDGKEVLMVTVDAEQWKQWCHEQNRPLRHAEVFPYVTWLRRSEAPNHSDEDRVSEDADVLPNDA